MNEEIFNRVKKVLYKHFGQIEVKYDTVAKDVDGWDSLTHIKIINDIQSEFNIKFTMPDLRSFSCVGKIVDCLERKLNQ